jgi:hypothetical protein
MSDSESLFENYLKKHNFSYDEEFPVNPGNIDFKIDRDGFIVLCDVKEVRDRKQKSYALISPQNQIRNDIKKLRRKFGKQRPSLPVVLVTMNFGSNFFAGFSVHTALIGDVSVNIKSELFQLPKGNAALTKSHNASISAVLVFDVRNQIQHVLFRNPFTYNPIPEDYFPVWKTIDLNPNASHDELKSLSVMFWPRSFETTY